MKTKKIPVRKCVGCGEGKNKRDLIRVVKNKENEVFVDYEGKANGRGAYLCDNVDCLEKAIKSKAFERAFEMKISDEIKESLKDTIESHK
ncbi:MAG: YlxR family protein [Tissierellia bacterium]|nr:YlxR family protein [Tissierellia bacterium]